MCLGNGRTFTIECITVKVIYSNFFHKNVNITFLPYDMVILWQVKFISLLMVFFAFIISHLQGCFPNLIIFFLISM